MCSRGYEVNSTSKHIERESEVWDEKKKKKKKKRCNYTLMHSTKIQKHRGAVIEQRYTPNSYQSTKTVREKD